MRLWLSGPRILGGLVRPGVSFSQQELFGKRPTNPLLAMTDAENYLALADAYAKIEKLPEAHREKARLAVEAANAYRTAQLAVLAKRSRRTWPWWVFLFVMLSIPCAIAYYSSTQIANGPCTVTDSNGDKQLCTPAP